jgi:exosortase A
MWQYAGGRRMSVIALENGDSQTPAMPMQISKWKSHLAYLSAAWAGLLLIFHRDAADMAMIWWNISTFNHCLLILPIIGWLIHQRQPLLLQLTPRTYWPALLYIGAAASGWLLGDAAGLAVARQLGLIMMLQGSACALLGLNVTRGLAFPLLYLFFLLPIGEEAVPMLQTLTAKMSMVLLGWTNIPAHIDGIFITTPTGYFKVAEACSGVQFLVAMVAYGALVANLCFKSIARRAAFMALCIVVPILANGIRAFGTIYIAHHTSIEFAAGFDHVFYGWIFFGIVIALVMAIGWHYFDKSADEPAFDPAKLPSDANRGFPAKVIIAAMLAIVAAPILWSNVIAARATPVPAQISLPDMPGWKVTQYAPLYPWMPQFKGTSSTAIARYRNANGETVDLYIALYNRQSEGRELIGFGQGSVNPDSKWVWTADLTGPSNAKAERITAPGPFARDVVSFYRVGGVTSGSAGQIKIATLKTRLLGGNQQAAAILVSTEHRSNVNSRAVLDAFIKDLGNIDNLADRAAGLR